MDCGCVGTARFYLPPALWPLGRGLGAAKAAVASMIPAGQAPACHQGRRSAPKGVAQRRMTNGGTTADSAWRGGTARDWTLRTAARGGPWCRI